MLNLEGLQVPTFLVLLTNLVHVVNSFGEGMDDINKRLVSTMDLIEEYSQTRYNILELRDRLNRQKRRSIEPIMHTGRHSNIWLHALTTLQKNLLRTASKPMSVEPLPKMFCPRYFTNFIFYRNQRNFFYLSREESLEKLSIVNYEIAGTW